MTARAKCLLLARLVTAGALCGGKSCAISSDESLPSTSGSDVKDIGKIEESVTRSEVEKVSAVIVVPVVVVVPVVALLVVLVVVVVLVVALLVVLVVVVTLVAGVAAE